MNANRFGGPLAAAALTCLCSSSPANAQAETTDPWARVPAFTTQCFQNVDDQPDPFYAELEAAKAANQAELEAQQAVNTAIEEDFRNIDPMEKAQRMQQWMMNNPEEAMKFAQAQQAAPDPSQVSPAPQQATRDEEWNALVKDYEDARLAAYAPAEARRKALAGKVGYAYSSAREDLLNPFMGFTEDPSVSTTDWGAGEAISAEFDRAYQELCPQWWGADGKFQAYLKSQKDWFISQRIPELESMDAPKLQQYAIMQTPTASYRSTADYTAVNEYLDLALKAANQRDYLSRCSRPQDCDGTY
jgi:hypothetical protein